MACKTSFELHHNFPKLAEESGFTFNTHKPRVHINWNKIKLIDIDNLIRNRKFVLVEQHINDILDCVLESEFDVRILDEGVVKIFRLAQLAVEYQQFCRHYLDRSVFILKEEVTNLLQELDTTKKNLREKEEEIRKLKRRSKHTIRTPLPYGNENIATMILKTLNQNKGELFTSTSQIDSMQYNKCNYCEKVFLNQLYLKSHISRRHANITEMPQRDTEAEISNVINTKLSNEVDELKTKLKQMEDFISSKYNSNNQTTVDRTAHLSHAKNDEVIVNDKCKKEVKDAEVSTTEDEYILDKIQEWKNGEHKKYNEELSFLRKQITEIMSSKEKDNPSPHNDTKMMEELHATIKQQGNEILALKRELNREESSENEKRKKIEEQVEFWIKRAEMQSNECKSLLHKLNEMATQAQECRHLANTERERANNLEKLLQNHLNKTSPKHSDLANEQNVSKHNKKETNSNRALKTSTKDVQIKPTVDVITLKKLQQKAQELLNIDQTTSSDSSSTHVKNAKTEQTIQGSDYEDNAKKKKTYEKANHKDIATHTPTLQPFDKMDTVKNKYTGKKQSTVKSKSPIKATSKRGNGYVYVPGSPLKIVRAKITEEVNHRLVSLGVDPLSSRLPQHVFQKQRKLLQEQQEYKSKKCPSREKVLHSIMCHLDDNTNSTNSIKQNAYLSPYKSRKTFSISSALSNVKTKALSLIKHNEPSVKLNKSYDDVAKKAMLLLKTPPGSTHSSPLILRKSTIDSPEEKHFVMKSKNNQYQSSKIKTKYKAAETSQITDSSNESYSEDDEHQRKNNDLFKISERHTTDNVDKFNSISQHKKIFRENGLKSEGINVAPTEKKDESSDDVGSIVDISPRKFVSEENLRNSRQTKGVLKNASSTSSLNKKKVLFDMEAIQMKSVSASPSQSIADKSDNNEKYGIGMVNLETEEWDISSIENEPIRTTETKIRVSSHTTPKIAELKNAIESQLTRRNPVLSSALVGGVDVLAATPMQKAASHGGSNTSLGSSILDDTDSGPVPDHKTVLKPRVAFAKDDSEIEISDILDNNIENKKIH